MKSKREWERERKTEARATARANILFNLKHYRKFSGNYARCSNATAAAWRQLETRSSQLSTCNSQGATLNLQLATEPKYPHRIHILHCPQSQHMSKVASCLLQLQLMLMNCCCPPPLTHPPCCTFLKFTPLACCQQISVHFSQLTKFFISF